MLNPQQIFDKYSNNLEITFSEVFPEYVDQIKGKYLCPICFCLFSKEDLNNKILTLEHVPPKSIGWKCKVLTCKNCNNNIGSKLESHIPKNNLLKAFGKSVKGTKMNSSFIFNDEFKANGLINIIDHLTYSIEVDPKRTDPKELEKINALYKEGGPTPNVKFTIQGGNLKRSMIALLKSAYLWGFNELGYGFIMNKNLQNIRDQILNPSLSIYDQKFIITGKFSLNTEGIYLLRSKSNLQFYATFLRNRSHGINELIGIIMPGGHNNAMIELSTVRTELENPVSLEFYNLNDISDFITDRATEMIKFWDSKNNR